jgi:cyclopropane-fatty-acyl-phospholipid synthase
VKLLVAMLVGALFAAFSFAFEDGLLRIFQTLVSKRARGVSGLPLTRADLYQGH